MLKKIACFFISIIGCRFVSIGKNNKLIKKGTVLFRNTKIVVKGKNNKIIFGKNCNIKGLRVLILGDSNLIDIGNDVVINASKIQPTIINAVGGKTIKIGDRSLLSNNIEIHTSDYHKIFDNNGNRINPDKDISIGKNVWIGLGTKILKGTKVADGIVIGAGSVIAGDYANRNTIICGNPAKVIRENILWRN